MARTFAAEVNASMVSQRDDNVAAMLKRLRAEYGDRTDPEAVDAQNSLQTQINELNADTSNQVTLLEPEGGVTEIGAGRVTTIAMSLAAGLVLGCAAALFASNATRRIDTDYDLVDKLGIEPLDVLPAPDDAPHAGTRAVRVQHLLNLLVRDADGRPVTVAVAPAGTGTGRAAHDLAEDIARQRAAQGERTVLVQADLRNGSDNRPGLAELLASGAPSEIDFMVENPTDDLDVVRPGTTNGDPYELFDRAAVRAVLTSLRERARFIVVSSPSMSRAGEAQVLGDLSDSVLLVVEEGTSLTDVQESIRTVAQVDGRLVGVVLVERTARGRS
jgi:Mrp family chromosome partitioning ATPase